MAPIWQSAAEWMGRQGGGWGSGVYLAIVRGMYGPLGTPLFNKKWVGMSGTEVWFTPYLLVLFFPVADFGVTLQLDLNPHTEKENINNEL